MQREAQVTAIATKLGPDAANQRAIAVAGSEMPLPAMTLPRSKRTGAFTDNMSLPVHRRFRYSAGFSAAWVEDLINKKGLTEDDVIFDPFAGSGTTMVAAQARNVSALGAESHYFVRRVANAKLLWSKVPERDLLDICAGFVAEAKVRESAQQSESSGLLRKCYSPESLKRLGALRNVYRESFANQSPVGELLWLAITSILRECSGVGTAQWQYVLPNKTKAKVQDPFAAFAARIKLFCADIAEMKNNGAGSEASVESCDARSLAAFAHLHGRVKLIITSPPYPNNYDYADATRLEMTFWGEIDGWGGLQQAVRRHLVRSCSQHSAAERLELDKLLADEAIDPIKAELIDVCSRLAAIRVTRGGKKTYHTMVAAYFADLAKVWRSLYPLCAAGSEVCFVIGDAAPYGIYVPAERWLGELALAAGFRTWTFEKFRDRNVKWKNRKHRVPLKEGNLWVTN